MPRQEPGICRGRGRDRREITRVRTLPAAPQTEKLLRGQAMRHHSRSIATDGSAEPPATVARPDRGRNGRPLLQLAGPTHVPSTGRLDARGQQTLLQHALTESTAKDRTRVLLLEGISETAANVLAGTGFRNLSLLPRALAGADLGDALRGVTLLGIRSST